MQATATVTASPVTHDVFNQPKPLVGYNLFEANCGLRDALKFNAPQLELELELATLTHLGETLGSEAMQLTSQMGARRLVQDVALVVQAALLYQYSTPAVFSAFCTSRLGGDWGYAFGTLPSGMDFSGIIARAMPH